MKQLLTSLAIALTAALALAEAQAAVPDALLSNDDRRYQEQAVQNALEFNRTGQTEAWQNPATGNRGVVTPTQTYRDWAGRDCRKYDRVFSVSGRQAQGWGTRCRTPAGTWLRPFAPRPAYVYHHHHYYRPYPYYYRPYPYYYWPVTFHLVYRFGGHHHHRHYRRWRRR